MTFSQISKTVLCRAYQVPAFVLKYLLPWGEKAQLKGTGSSKKLAVYIKNKNVDNVLIIADSAIEKSSAASLLTEKLSELGIKYSVVTVSADANAETAEKCAITYKNNGCKAIVAIGGGSVIDCAKLTAIKASNRKKNIADIKGFKPIMRKSTMLFAVPTTVGSGSEITSAATCFDKKAKCRNIILSPSLRPDAAVLDPIMTEALPREVIAKTSMAALCNAIEAYICTSGTKSARESALIAIRLIFDNALKAYNDNDTDARIELQKAAYLAGTASDRNHAGYAHHIALAVSAAGKASYGEAAASALIRVLEEYNGKANRKLSVIADALKFKGENEAEKANKLIAEIKTLANKLSVESRIKQIKKKDIPNIANTVCRYCNPSYPAPKQLFYDGICSVITKMKK